MVNGRFPEVEFDETKRLNLFWSDHTCFAETIKNRKNISTRIIQRYFDKLVDKDDYAKNEKWQEMNYLIEKNKEEDNKDKSNE